MVVSLSTWMAACPSWWRGVSLLEGTDAFLSGWRVSSPANFEDHPHQIYHELNKDTWMLFQKSLIPFNWTSKGHKMLISGFFSYLCFHQQDLYCIQLETKSFSHLIGTQLKEQTSISRAAWSWSWKREDMISLE